MTKPGNSSFRWSNVRERSTVNETRPDLLVMGTRDRSKLLTTLLDIIAEECLQSLDVDVLAAPPLR